MANEVYYILLAPKSGEALKNDGEIILYASRDEANTAAVEARAANPDQHYLIEGPFTTDKLDWKARERARLADGTHKPLLPSLEVHCLPDHFAHVAKGDPTALAYTKHEADGVRDVQKRMNVTAYLKLYAPDVSPYEAAWLQEEHHHMVADAELLLATTPEEIVEVYTNYDEDAGGGVAASCMRYEKSQFTGSEHPVVAYGNSDLAVAYVKNGDGETTARTVVWPARRCYSRLYGNERSLPALTAALRKAGYKASCGYYGGGSGNSEHSLEGARLRAVWDENRKGRLIVPYVDECSYGELDSKKVWITLRNSQPSQRMVQIKDTSGVSSVQGPRCPSCRNFVTNEEDFVNAFTTYPQSEDHVTRCCENCSFVCYGSKLRFSTNVVQRSAIDGHYYAYEWAKANMPACGLCLEFMPASLLTMARMSLDKPSSPTCPSCCETTFWCEEAKELTHLSLQARKLNLGTRKKVTIGNQVRLKDRGYSLLSKRAAEHPDYSELHALAMAEAASGERKVYLLLNNGKPLLTRPGVPRTITGFIEARDNARSGLTIALDSEELRARIPRVGSVVRVINAYQFDEAKGSIGRIVSAEAGVYRREYLVRLADGRDAFCGNDDIEVLPAMPEGVVMMTRPDPVPGALVHFCCPSSPRFGQRGVIDEIDRTDQASPVFVVKFSDGSSRRASRNRIQMIGEHPQGDLFCGPRLPAMPIPVPPDPNHVYSVGDRVRFTPRCVDVSIPRHEVGRFGTVIHVGRDGAPDYVESDGGNRWSVRRESVEPLDSPDAQLRELLG